MVRNVFRYFETRLAGNHECDGQMDGQTEWPLAIVRRVLKMQLFSQNLVQFWVSSPSYLWKLYTHVV